MFQPLNISASALTAQRLRMDVISSNIANATTTRGRFVDGQWLPYRRKMVVMEPRQANRFQDFLQTASERNAGTAGGVRVTAIVDDPTPFRRVYDPGHPDADAEGYVLLPNVDLAKEMIDLAVTTRAYEANVSAFQAGKAMIVKALEIGR
ncbi:flagellar basal body rod protein FlgC [Bacillaceae bacterium]